MKKLKRGVMLEAKILWLSKLDLSIRIVYGVSFAFDCLISTHGATLCEPLRVCV